MRRTAFLLLAVAVLVAQLAHAAGTNTETATHELNPGGGWTRSWTHHPVPGAANSVTPTHEHHEYSMTPPHGAAHEYSMTPTHGAAHEYSMTPTHGPHAYSMTPAHGHPEHSMTPAHGHPEYSMTHTQPLHHGHDYSMTRTRGEHHPRHSHAYIATPTHNVHHALPAHSMTRTVAPPSPTTTTTAMSTVNATTSTTAAPPTTATTMATTTAPATTTDATTSATPTPTPTPTATAPTTTTAAADRTFVVIVLPLVTNGTALELASFIRESAFALGALRAGITADVSRHLNISSRDVTVLSMVVDAAGAFQFTLDIAARLAGVTNPATATQYTVAEVLANSVSAQRADWLNATTAAFSSYAQPGVGVSGAAVTRAAPAGATGGGGTGSDAPAYCVVRGDCILTAIVALIVLIVVIVVSAILYSKCSDAGVLKRRDQLKEERDNTMYRRSSLVEPEAFDREYGTPLALLRRDSMSGGAAGSRRASLSGGPGGPPPLAPPPAAAASGARRPSLVDPDAYEREYGAQLGLLRRASLPSADAAAPAAAAASGSRRPSLVMVTPPVRAKYAHDPDI